MGGAGAGSQTFAITPISAHTPMRASFSVAESTPITLVQVGRFPISVCVDGQESFDEFAPNDVAHIVADPRRFRLVTFGGTSFYGRFRQRFNYRIRPGYRASRLFHSTTTRRRVETAHIARHRAGGHHRVDGLLDRDLHVDDGRTRVQRGLAQRTLELVAPGDGRRPQPCALASAAKFGCGSIDWL